MPWRTFQVSVLGVLWSNLQGARRAKSVLHRCGVASAITIHGGQSREAGSVESNRCQSRARAAAGGQQQQQHTRLGCFLRKIILCLLNGVKSCLV